LFKTLVLFFKIRLISIFLIAILFGPAFPPSNLTTSSSGDFEYTTSLNYDFEQIKHTVPFIKKDFIGFKEFLGFFESGSDYKKINRLGYLGKYQFGKSTLKVLKIDYLKNDFINEPAVQERAFLMNVMRNKWILRREISRFNGLVISDMFITESGIIAAAHLSGPGNVKKFLRSYCDSELDLKDANGTKISDYLKTFKNYNISEIEAVRKPSYIN
jgi:hypothetical protein